MDLTNRPRRLRRTPALRAAFAETRVHPRELVMPLFIKEGLEGAEPIGSMPGVSQFGIDAARAEAERLMALGVASFLLFGIPLNKDDAGSSGWDTAGPVPTALRALRRDLGGEAVLWADVCSCEYTSHGHCGPRGEDGDVRNDAAVEGYVRAANAYAEAGADIVAPSGMMDGQVAAIRSGLDRDGFDSVAIVAYAAKYASAFYGPFRDAAESAPADGDRRSYQMNPPNADEALREVALDIEQGADVIMVKPALPYLDIVRAVRDRFDVPVAAYHVSGEYAMVKAAAERGWVDGERVMAESVLSIRRAGATQIITYAAADLAEVWANG